MANNSFIETIATGTFEVSKTRYDQLLDIETKYNQLYERMYINTTDDQETISHTNILDALIIIDVKRFNDLDKKYNSKEDK